MALEDETTLIVRGVESGETVNVYNKDNELIGSAKQDRNMRCLVQKMRAV
ncbi:hypothetical protein CNEO4_2590001 [Clostridium neonatale]|nr:hypothetical protein CNEO4_2590001 [Clostridium neonatale]